jgi:di/tricarboxylate transporter
VFFTESIDIILTLGIIAVAIFLFVQERLSIDTVAILVMVAFMVTGILTPEEGFAGFNNSATITVGAMFVLSAAIFKTGILDGVSTLLARAGRTNYYVCLLLIMVFSGTLSAFINDTAVVAMLMPVVIKVARDTNISPGKLLMPLSFGALLGGVCTLVGTSTNILVSGIAEKHGLKPFGMFEMSSAGVFFMIAGIIYIIAIGSRLMPNRKATSNLKEVYDMQNFIAEVQVTKSSQLAGKMLNSSSLLRESDIEVLVVMRDGRTMVPYPSFVLEADDVLQIRSNIENLTKLVSSKDLEIVKSEGQQLDEQNEEQRTLVEAMLPPDSRFSGQTLRKLRFRQAFNGAAVLAIRSRNEVVHEQLGNVRLKTGDVLLLQVTRDQLDLLRNNHNLMVLSEQEHAKLRPLLAIPTLLIVASAIVLAAMHILPIVLSASLSALVLIVFGFIKPEEAYNAIQWKVIFMLAGVLSMGMALEKTGAAQLLGEQLIAVAGGYGPRVMVSVLFFITFMATNVMSNNASAALLAPIAIVIGTQMGVDPRPLLMAVTFAASLAFMTPMGYQTNAMIYGPGNYRFKDYLRVGTPLNILLWIVASIVIPYFFPF